MSTGRFFYIFIGGERERALTLMGVRVGLSLSVLLFAHAQKSRDLFVYGPSEDHGNGAGETPEERERLREPQSHTLRALLCQKVQY